MSQNGNSKLEKRNSEMDNSRDLKLENRNSKIGNGLLAFLFAAVMLVASPALAQVATGIPPFSSATPSTFDTIDNANLNVHFAIPILSRPGAGGLYFSYVLSYDNSIWQPYGSTYWYPNINVLNWGWQGTAGPVMGYASYDHYLNSCVVGSMGYQYDNYSSWVYKDAQGALHSFNIVVSDGQSTPCPNVPPYTQTVTATDGSGLTMTATAAPSATLYSPGGVAIVPSLQTDSPTSGSATITDPNGNVISGSYSSTGNTFYDTLSSTTPALTVSTSGAPSQITYTYTDPSGSTNYPFTVIYKQFYVQTNFGCPGISEFGPAQDWLVNEIDLPDKTKYTFSYEATPGYTSNTTGRIAGVRLPTGGSISYSYADGSHDITCADGSTAKLTRTTPDGTWTYAHTESGSSWGTSVFDPMSELTDYDFQGVLPTERAVYSTGGTLLESVYTCYNGASFPCNGTGITLPITEVSATMELGSEEAQTNTYHNSYGLVTKVDEYNFGNGSVGAIERETMTCYEPTINGDIVNRPWEVMVYNGAGNPSNCTGTSGLAAETSYDYDGHGNMTTEVNTNTGGSPGSISRSFTYNTNGTLATATDFDSSSHLTTYTYASGANSCYGAFPTEIALPVSALTYYMGWNCNGGVPTSITDPNSQKTTFTYDSANHFWRLAGIGYPDGGSETINYTDKQGGPFTVADSRLVSSVLGNHTVTQTLDGLGRAYQVEDNSASSYVVTAFDSLGRVHTVTNPYFSTRDPTYGVTTYGYDALNRVTSAEAPDGSTRSTTYTGNCATATDPANKARTLCSDALRRVYSVAEDPNHLNYQTTYTYDPLNDLTGVAQGSQARTYTYDMFGRLTSSKVPEVNSGGTLCTTSYGYDANGNLTSKTAPQENQTSCSSTVTTTYAYDAVNRLTSKSYSDGSTPTANFFYDQAPSSWPAWPGVSFGNPEGRLILTCTNTTAGTCTSPATATAYSYDAMGRPLYFWQCNPSNCGTSSIWEMQYTYDLAGDVTSWTHPAGYTVTNTPNAAQQVTAIASSLSDPTHPQYLAQSVSYTAWGAISQLVNGCAGSGCTNAQETYEYNTLLQPAVIELGTPGNNAATFCFVYDYYGAGPTGCSLPSPGTNNNGNVMGYWYNDNFDSNFPNKESYTYDSLNRLATATAKSLGGTTYWSRTFAYDRWGNGTCSRTGLVSRPDLQQQQSAYQHWQLLVQLRRGGEPDLRPQQFPCAPAHTYSLGRGGAGGLGGQRLDLGLHLQRRGRPGAVGVHRRGLPVPV